jgi:hypothetical protein
VLRLDDGAGVFGEHDGETAVGIRLDEGIIRKLRWNGQLEMEIDVAGKESARIDIDTMEVNLPVEEPWSSVVSDKAKGSVIAGGTSAYANNILRRKTYVVSGPVETTSLIG